MKRPPRISAEAAAKRRPLSPLTLLQQAPPVMQRRVSRLLSSRPIRKKP